MCWQKKKEKIYFMHAMAGIFSLYCCKQETSVWFDGGKMEPFGPNLASPEN